MQRADTLPNCSQHIFEYNVDSLTQIDCEAKSSGTRFPAFSFSTSQIHLNGLRPTCAPFFGRSIVANTKHASHNQFTDYCHFLQNRTTQAAWKPKSKNRERGIRFVWYVFLFFLFMLNMIRHSCIWRWETEDVATGTITSMGCLVVIVVAPRITFPFFFFFVASVSFHSALAGNQPSPSAPYRRHRAIEVKCDIVRQSMFENKFHWKYSGIVCNCGIGRIRAYIKIVLCVCIKNLFYFVESFGRDAVRHSNPIGASTAHSRQPALRCRHMRLTRRAESLFDFHFSSRTTSVPHHGHAALSPRLTLHTYIQ